MQALSDWLRARWPAIAFLASGAMLAGAHAFERFGGLEPCVLCLAQRERHWLVLAIAAGCFVLMLLLKQAIVARAAALALALAFGWSTYEAGHHVAVEQGWVIATCETDMDLNDIQPLTMDGPLVAPSCDTPAWTMFGVSMAGYNALISLALLLASLYLAFAPRARYRVAPAHVSA